MTAKTRDGRQLHYERHGDGSPIVVFEAGMGASRNSWGAVVPAVADRTTTVIYDRSGLGQNAPDPERRDLARLTDDLEDLLDHLGAGPFVLVGHSWGGPIVRSAAARLPDGIAGLVLVDQTDEGCDLFFSDANERQFRLVPKLMPTLGELDVARERTAAAVPWHVKALELRLRLKAPQAAFDLHSLRELRETLGVAEFDRQVLTVTDQTNVTTLHQFLDSPADD